MERDRAELGVLPSPQAPRTEAAELEVATDRMLSLLEAVLRDCASGAAPEATLDEVFSLLVKNGGASRRALSRLMLLHEAMVAIEEQEEAVSRLVPAEIVDRVRQAGADTGRPELVEATVVISDIRGYTSIAERVDPVALALQLNDHRVVMSRVITGSGGTVMQYVGDSVMAVFGALLPMAAHASMAIGAAESMHHAQDDLNESWSHQGRPPFGLGIGVSTGTVAAALLGSSDRLEFTVVGDVVNLAQRLQHWARPGETVVSQATYAALPEQPVADRLDPTYIDGRTAPVTAFRLGRRPT